MLTFKAIHGTAPEYIQDMIQLYEPARPLRSMNDKNVLVTPRVKTKNYGERSFSVAAPKNLNSMPKEIRSETRYERCKTLVKTFLFRQAFLQYL